VTPIPKDERRDSAAVIGSGVAGLTAAYLLQRRFDVTLFESAERLGGHAHTHDVVTPDTGTLLIDSGFIVYNEDTYPQLCRLLAELRIPTQTTDMSMSIRCEGCGLEYAGGRGASGVFAQPRSAVRPRFVKLLWEVRRFHREAKASIAEGNDGLTLGEFLSQGRYSDYFVRHFVIPVVSCVWSAATGVALEYPARYLFIFLDNHGMLSVSGSPTWRTISGGSRTYVDQIAKGVHAVRTGTPVRSIVRTAGRLMLHDEFDQVASFDRVVVATHADEALRMLAQPTENESRTLGAFAYSRNETWLHGDESVLPRALQARASWNYLLRDCHVDTDAVLVSYDMNRLQSLPSHRPHLVTLNATDRIDPALVLDRMTYTHPIYSLESVAAQQRLPELNDGEIAFAGAYHGWGFHEDGCRSGVMAAASLGAPW
jgi:predicted NAD/FAD-binding protein